MQTCAPNTASRPLLAGLAAALLAACASQPAPPAQVETPPAAPTVDTLKSQVVTVATLTPEDPGIAALARAVSGVGLVSFEGGLPATLEEAALKSALTEALIQSGQLGMLILDVPCDGAAVLNDFASAGQASILAADLVREAPIPETQKSGALADMLMLLRGWNAVNADQPITVMGMHCDGALETTTGRTAIFWGLDQLPAHTGEKEMAAAALAYGEPAENHVWIVQTDAAILEPLIAGSGWIDLRALPEDAAVAAWRQETATEIPLLRPDHPSAADILFRHPARTPAEAF